MSNAGQVSLVVLEPQNAINISEAVYGYTLKEVCGLWRQSVVAMKVTWRPLEALVVRKCTLQRSSDLESSYYSVDFVNG